MAGPLLLDLSQHCNEKAATYDHLRHEGCFNAWGNSFPAEELPSGSHLRLGTLTFLLPRTSAHADHLCATGQQIAFPFEQAIDELLVLCAGEMGTQLLQMTFFFADRSSFVTGAIAKSWLVTKCERPSACLVFSHLHYPGGYELDLLRPVLWVTRVTLPAGLPPVRLLGLGINPLFHVFAITCMSTTAE